MAMDLSSKKIIMIHGLASKPPEKALHELWARCVLENIALSDAPLAAALRENPHVFHSAYWANAVPHHIEDDLSYVKRLQLQVDKTIAERKKLKGEFHVGTGEKIGAFFKDKGVSLVKILAGALTVKDDVMRALLRETELYQEDQYIADQMRLPLETALREAWDKQQQIAIVSHSMGSFIAYDVLWRFAHRHVAGFKEYKKQRVRLLVTMGSPLGEIAVRDMLFAHYHKDAGKRQFPTNIDYWHNYACLGDVVSHQHDFDELFFSPMRGLRLFPATPRYRAIDYTNLHNPFEVVPHAGNKGKEKRNPHKSYGYLVQPRLGTWLADFLCDRLAG